MTSLGRKIAASARKGALMAAKKYSKISVNGTLWNRGIENYIGAKIAEQIYQDTEGSPVELEYSYQNILARLDLVESNSNLTEASALTSNSRFDVTVFRKNNKKPYGIIEIKKRFTDYNILKDRKRVLECIKFCHQENSGIRFGIVLAVEADWQDKKRPEQKIDDALKKLNEETELYRAEIEYSSITGNFGETKSNKNIIGINAYTTLFRLE